MNNNVGKFIKSQREKNNISQTKLAEMLFIDRTLISKWENDKITPGVKDIIAMSKLFNISVEEFLSKEEYSIDNEEEIKNNFNDYLIKQDNKLHKLKKYVLILSIISIAFLLIFFIYYFYQTYNKTRVYIVSGKSEKYEFHNGIFILTRGKSYLKIGSISADVDKVKIFYQINGNEKIIYEGEPNDIKKDTTGYNSSINLHNIDKIINDIKMIIYSKNGKSELVDLKFEEDFANKYLIYSDMDNIGKKVSKDVLIIPEKIKKNFICDELICRKNIDDIEISYDINLKTMYLKHNNENVTYRENTFIYDNLDNNFFTVIDNNYNLGNFDSEKAKNIYDYYMNLILKYIG